VGEPAPSPSDPGTDALFEEARRLRRRRWLIGSSVCAAGALAIGIGAALWLGGPAHGLQRIGRSGPLVDLSALHDEGELAFVSRDELYLVDGSARTVHEIPVQPGWTALDPSFSHDGKWVAYEALSQSAKSPSRAPDFWIARADGSGRRRIVGAAQSFGWSPSADLLAVSTDTRARAFRGWTEIPTRVELISPPGTRRPFVTLTSHSEATVATAYQVWSAAWSPTGAALAVSLVSITRGSIVRSYPVDGEAPTTWFAIGGKAALPGICTACGGGGTIADLAGWWKSWGMGFWVFSSGAVRNLDSTPLELVHSPGATPHIIGRTLSDGTTDATSAGPAGSLAIVASARDAGREYGIGKEIETCVLAGRTCAPIPGASTWLGKSPLSCSSRCQPTPPPGRPGSAVTLDPAWSPTEKLLAYVKSPAAFHAGNPALAWFAAHELFVYDPATRRSTRIAGIDGASVPTWSTDGTSLLYVARNALWLAPAAGGAPREVATPLFAPAQWVHQDTGDSISFYGQIDWTGQFAWRSP
jgi:hypothetical protein